MGIGAESNGSCVITCAHTCADGCKDERCIDRESKRESKRSVACASRYADTVILLKGSSSQKVVRFKMLIGRKMTRCSRRQGKHALPRAQRKIEMF